MFEYDSITVSYAWELVSVSMCYSQGDGFNTSLLRLCTVPTSHSLTYLHAYLLTCLLWCTDHLGLCIVSGLLLPVALSCATRDDANKDNVCTPTISSGINRPPHPDHLAYILSAEPTKQSGTFDLIRFIFENDEDRGSAFIVVL